MSDQAKDPGDGTLNNNSVYSLIECTEEEYLEALENPYSVIFEIVRDAIDAFKDKTGQAPSAIDMPEPVEAAINMHYKSVWVDQDERGYYPIQTTETLFGIPVNRHATHFSLVR